MFSALKGMIFEEDPNAVKAAPPKAAPATLPTAAPSTQVSNEFVSAIRKVVLARNTALTQLLAAADKLTTIIPDANVRFKAAFATAGDGRSVKQIAEAVDIHISDVDGEELRFKAAIDQKAAIEVGALEQRAQMAASAIVSAQNALAQAQQRIAELTEQITRQQTEQAAALSEASVKRSEIEQVAMQFKMAAEHVRHELQSNKSTILSALS